MTSNRVSNWYARNVGRLSAPAPAAAPQLPQRASFQQPQSMPRQQNNQQKSLGPGGVYGNWGTIEHGSGGISATMEDNCPSCGSQNYFLRDRFDAAKDGKYRIMSLGKRTPNGVFSPSPHCWDCGYNAIWEHQVPPDPAES